MTPKKEAQEKQGRNWTEIIRPLFYQMLKGLEFMHRNNPILFHGNLKPNNILIDSDKNLRLVDFGFGRLCALKHQYSGPCINYHDDTFHPICWKPPEFYCISTTYTGRSDMHSAGMIAYYMMTGGKEHPFVTYSHMLAKELQENVCTGNYQIQSSPKEAVDLLQKMLEVNAEARPEAWEVTDHPYFWCEQKRFSFVLEVARWMNEVRNGKNDKDPEDLNSVQAKLNQGVSMYANEVFSNGDWRMNIPEEMLEEVEDIKRDSSVTGLLLFILDTCRKRRQLQTSHARNPTEFFLATFPDLFTRVFLAVERGPLRNRTNIREFYQKDSCDTTKDRSYG